MPYDSLQNGPSQEEALKFQNTTRSKGMMITFLSCPALASIFPSDEKWQEVILLVLARTEFTSVNVKPGAEARQHCS